MKRGRRKPKRTQLERREETQGCDPIGIDQASGRARIRAASVQAALRPTAGVSRGAQEHYFPKKNDLIAAATRYAMREAVEHARSLARSATRSQDPIAKFLKDSEHFFFTPRVPGHDRDHDRGAIGSRVGPHRPSDRSGCARCAERHLDRHARCGWISARERTTVHRANPLSLAGPFRRNKLAALPCRPRGGHRRRGSGLRPRFSDLRLRPVASAPLSAALKRANQRDQRQRFYKEFSW